MSFTSRTGEKLVVRGRMETERVRRTQFPVCAATGEYKIIQFTDLRNDIEILNYNAKSTGCDLMGTWI